MNPLTRARLQALAVLAAGFAGVWGLFELGLALRWWS